MENINLKLKEKLLLFFAGISLPLITLRIELPMISISLFMISIVLLILLNIKLVVNSIRIKQSDFLIDLFLFVTLISIIYSDNVVYGLTQWIKLLIVVVLFVFMRTLFCKKIYYIEIIMRYSSISLAFFLLYLIWVYIIKFNQTYIGIETAYITKSGKNSLSFLVSFVLPFTLVNFTHIIQKKGLKLFELVLMLLTLWGAFLIQSRALFLLIMIYSFLLFFTLKISWRIVRTGIIVVVVFVILFTVLVPSYVTSDLVTRFSSILLLIKDDYIVQGNKLVTGVASLETRSYLINKGINMFFDKPFLGNGLGSFRYYEGISSAVSHNDYVQVAAEQGIIGLTIFLALIILYVWKAFQICRKNRKDLWIFLSMLGISFYLFMINAYDSIFLWVLLAIIDAKKSNLTEINLDDEVSF